MSPHLNKYTSFLSNVSIVSFSGCIDIYHPLPDYQTDSPDLHGYSSATGDLQVCLSMSNESMDVTHLLDVLGDQRGEDLLVICGFRSIIDYLSTNWALEKQIFNAEEHSHTLYSYFRPFIPERRDGELLEGVGRILGPLSDGFLQFLTYIINLLSNNLLSNRDANRIVQWIDDIQGYSLLTRLLLLKTPTIEAFASNLLLGAIRLDNVLLVSTLLKAGVNSNPPIGYRITRLLEYTAVFGSNKTARLLLKCGADVNTDISGYYIDNALQAASWNGNIELVRLLLKAGADVNAPGAKYGYTALQAASEKGDIELVRLLLNAGADVNAPVSEYNNIALQAASSKGDIELFRLLLDAGADVNAPGAKYSGRTALQAASEKGDIELVQLLLCAKADVNAPPSYDCGVTALQAAAIKGYIKVVQLLLDYGADVNAAPAVVEGRTALEGAAEHGRIDILQLLINAGAMTMGDGVSQYLRAVKLAEEEGHFVAAELLRSQRP